MKPNLKFGPVELEFLVLLITFWVAFRSKSVVYCTNQNSSQRDLCKMTLGRLAQARRLWPCIEGLAKSQGKVGGPWRMMVPIWPLAWTFETMGGHLSIVKASYSYFTRKMEKVGRIPLGVTPPRRRFFDDSNLLLDQPVTVTFFLFVLTYPTSFM